MGERSEKEKLYDMAGAMLKLGGESLEQFIVDYPDLAEPAHLRKRAWDIRTEWLGDVWELAAAVASIN